MIAQDLVYANDSQTQDVVKDYYENPKRKNLSGLQVSLSGHLLTTVWRCRIPGAATDSGFSTRKDIEEFSPRSAARMRRYLRTCVAEYRTFITLTYPSWAGADGRRAKRDLCVFLKRLRRRVESERTDFIRYSSFWFAEFQSNGTIHFHIFSTDRFPKEWIAQSWYEICGTEDQRHLRAGTRIESVRSGKKGICAYASKYAAKITQKRVPERFGWIGRFWGVSGCRITVSADTYVPTLTAKQPAVKKELKSLENAIEEFIFQGKMRLIVDRDGVRCWYIKEKWIESMIEQRIMRLSQAISVYFPQKHHNLWSLELIAGHDRGYNSDELGEYYAEKVLLQA